MGTSRFKETFNKAQRLIKMSRRIENEDINKIRVMFDDDEDIFKNRGQEIRSDSNSIFNTRMPSNSLIGGSSLMNRDPLDDDFSKHVSVINFLPFLQNFQILEQNQV